MPDLIANSVFTAAGREYRPGEHVPPDLPGWQKLMEKGFIVWDGGERAAREAAENEAKGNKAKSARTKGNAKQD